MDEAFVPLHQLLPELLPLTAVLEDEEHGVRQMVTGCEVETPIELDLVVGEGLVSGGPATGETLAAGEVQIGAAPPLYHFETSSLPVFHSVRIVVASEARDG